ncbi:MAG TPA: ABC transporter permease [Caldilineaceae bacterium]|nr:ABC transporter permease [Caldilineaceae bacterium]
MGQYALRRLWQMAPVLLIVSIAVFSIIHFIPGNPAQIIAGPNATPEQLAALEQRLGLDKPLWTQYLIWLRNVLSGELGVSYINNYPVRQLIAQRIPATVELALASTVIGVAIALPLGILAAVRPGSTFDFVTTTFSALSFAIPSFYLLILLIMLFSVELRWLPPSGRPSLADQPGLWVKSIILPAFTLGIGVAAKLTRYLRSALLEVLDQDYIRTARAKGLRERITLWRHALPNALIPVVTVLGLQLGDLLSGAIIVESIYAWPGVGRLTIQAIEWRDYALLQANVLFIVLAFLLVNLITDLTYGLLDPRIRYNGG